MKYGIANVKAKIGGGGGADLNLAYGLTPPSDTSKIWVKCSEPSKVKIEANRNLVVSSDENAKVLTNTTIPRTNIDTSFGKYLASPLVKIGNDYYFLSISSSGYIFGNTGIPTKSIQKYSSGGGTLSISLIALLNNEIYSIFKYSDTELIAICADLPNSKCYIYKVNITTQTYTAISTLTGTTLWAETGCYYNDAVFHLTYGDTSKIDIKKRNLNVSGITTKSFQITSLGHSSWVYSAQPRAVGYNGYLYFVLNLGGTTLDAATPYLIRWEIDSSSIEVVMQLPKLTYNGSEYGYGFYTPLIFGNKMILTNLYHSITAGTSPSADYVISIDLINGTYETISVGESYVCAYPCVDENTGNIEIWGGVPTSTRGIKKRVVSNIYELEENTLDLYYDVYYSKNIKLIDTATLTMDAPINHAWLGDSNDIAQPVNMYYYDNGTWKGINCEDYSE